MLIIVFVTNVSEQYSIFIIETDLNTYKILQEILLRWKDGTACNMESMSCWPEDVLKIEVESDL